MANQSLIERDYQIEKLEFAFAISQANGDKKRSNQIKNQMETMGFNYEEPGT